MKMPRPRTTATATRPATPPSPRVTRARAMTPRPDSPAPGQAPGGAIRVLCVEDHAVLVEGLRAQFAIDGRIVIVGRLATATNLQGEVARLRPDVVLLDIELPGPDAFEAADGLRRAQPEVRVIVLSAHIKDVFVSASISAGLQGYFAKSDELDDIVGGIYETVRSKDGPFLLGPKVRERCVIAYIPRNGRSRRSRRSAGTSSPDSPVTLRQRLTARESEVLRLIGKGRSRTQIAAELCRSVKTIDGHQDRMMRKLAITSRSELLRFAIREGFAEA